RLGARGGTSRDPGRGPPRRAPPPEPARWVTPLAEEPRRAKPAAAAVAPLKKKAAETGSAEHPAEKTAAVQYRDKQFAEAARILRAAADADPASAPRLNAMAKDFVAVGAGPARGGAGAAAGPPQSPVASPQA